MRLWLPPQVVPTYVNDTREVLCKRVFNTASNEAVATSTSGSISATISEQSTPSGSRNIALQIFNQSRTEANVIVVVTHVTCFVHNFWRGRENKFGELFDIASAIWRIFEIALAI
jgi:hypothetical protein